MKKTYLEIGKLYYETNKENPEGFFIQLCEEIALAEKNIADKEAEIADLKAEDDDSIEVEFEEIIEEDETPAAETPEAAEELIESIVDEIVDEAID